MHHHAIAGLILSALGAGSAIAHSHDPSWLESPIGLHLDLSGPMNVRGDGQAWATVHLLNLTTTPQYLQSIQLIRDGEVVDTNQLEQALVPVGKAAEQYRLLDAKIEAVLETDPEQARLLNAALQSPLATTSAASIVRRVDPGSDLSGTWSVEINTLVQGKLVQHVMPVCFSRNLPLPNGSTPAQQWVLDTTTGHWRVNVVVASRRGGTWLAGDQHLHTTWSLDAHALDGTEEGPAGYADAARAIGLDWIMITDHSNIHAWWGGEWFFTPEQHETARQEAANYRLTEDWPVLYSQEMGLGRTGFWDLPSHMLVYPLDTFDAPYLENPSSGLIFGLASCESEQVIIDRINVNGCYGFIAHPFKEGTLSYSMWDWDNGATGWAGFELWSDSSGDSEFQESDLAALQKWHELLGQIAAPTGGSLAQRPDFPTRFPVGIGNSDAHETSMIGSVFTYAQLNQVDPSSLREVLLLGRCIASDGPLVTIEINGAGIGDVAILPEGRGRVVVRLETTPEFGTVDQFTLVLEADGENIVEFPTESASGYAVEYIIDSPTMFQDVKYLTAWTQKDDLSRVALTNPVWLQSAAAGDVDGSGSVGVNDLLVILDSWGDCLGCPADTDGDGFVGVDDLLAVIGQWAP